MGASIRAISLKPIEDEDREGRNIVSCENSIQRIRDPHAAFLCGACGLLLVVGELTFVKPFLFRCSCRTLNAVSD